MPPPSFIDIEASGLGPGSWPIEVAWTLSDGTAVTHLIRPEPDWDHWDPSAEEIHGISRRQCEAEGRLPGQVWDELWQHAQHHELSSDAPSTDGLWLARLQRPGDPSIDLFDADRLLMELAERRSPHAPVAALEEAIKQAWGDAPIVHRAGPDARRLHRIWLVLQDDLGP